MVSLLKNRVYEQSVCRWAFAGLWIFITAFLWAPSRDGLEAIYALTFFIPMLLIIPWQRPRYIEYGGVINVFAILYASWSLVTSSWGGGFGFLLLQWLVLVMWLTGLSWVLQERQLDINKLLSWMLVIGSLVAILSIFLFYKDHSWGERLEGYGVSRTPTLVGQTFGAIVLIGIYLSWNAPDLKRALWLSLACIAPLAAMFLSQSRGPMLALIAVLILAFVWIRPRRPIVWIQLIAASIAATLLLTNLPVVEILLQRGVSLRDQIWGHIWQLVASDPLVFMWGQGLSENTKIATDFGIYHHAHNAWLDILYRTGVIGLCLALVHLGLLFWFARKHRNLVPLVLWLFYGCVCLFMNSRVLFWEIDAKWFMYWIPAGLLGALISAQRNNLFAAHSTATEQENS